MHQGVEYQGQTGASRGPIPRTDWCIKETSTKNRLVHQGDEYQEQTDASRGRVPRTDWCHRFDTPKAHFVSLNT